MKQAKARPTVIGQIGGAGGARLPSRRQCGGQAAPPAPPFDRLAARYDQLWTRTPTGSAQRGLVWRNLDGLFHPGERLLDIGCGTGADAAHFSARGIAVHATDCSPAMVDAARRRGGFTASVLRAEEIAEAGEIYDGAISNFGALNCVGDLAAVARSLARVVRPGGRVAICTIGRFCAWETLYYASRLRFRKAFRRLRGNAPSSLGSRCTTQRSRRSRPRLPPSSPCASGWESACWFPLRTCRCQPGWCGSSACSTAPWRACRSCAPWPTTGC
jgi:ubiquinone/menaquinone biosynthesis C-methylase UbiE